MFHLPLLAFALDLLAAQLRAPGSNVLEHHMHHANLASIHVQDQKISKLSHARINLNSFCLQANEIACKQK